MQDQIEKELLLARLHYLDEINNKLGSPDIHPKVSQKVKEMILNGSAANYLAVESLFNYLAENLPEDDTKADELAHDMVAFII